LESVVDMSKIGQEEILARVQADPARMEVLRASFDTLDRDNTGVVCVKNIDESMKALGVGKTDSEVAAMVKRFDVHNTGSISFDEFCIMMGPAYYDESIERTSSAGKKQSWEFELRLIFQAFDLERTGTINKKELREIMRRLGTKIDEKELEATLGAADENGDGVIDWEVWDRSARSLARSLAA